MTQTYTNPTSRQRMERGLCPECGQAPEDHYDRDTPALYVAIIAPCGLYVDGVRDRIEAHLKDQAHHHAADELSVRSSGAIYCSGCGHDVPDDEAMDTWDAVEPCCYPSMQTRGSQHAYDCENY